KIGGQAFVKPVPTETPDTATAPSRAITSSNDKVKVELYGQLNRGALYVNDGDKSKLYQVDNDNSSTRLGLRGSVQPHADWTLGTRFEVEYQSNASNVVNREETSTSGDNFVDRHIDIFLQSDTFGKVSIGKGDTASNNTSEVDLSGTTVAAYSDIAAVAGGQLFYDKSTDTLSGTEIGDVFNNFDGLSRKSRLRYDTPIWRGFSAATSVVSGTGGDVALFYSGKTDQFKIAAAGAYSDPGSDSDTIDNSWDGSASVLFQNGVNATVAAGLRELKLSGRDDPTFFYAKLGYIAELLSAGKTAFSVDYSFNEDVDEEGDEADAVGLQLVQNIDAWATEFYLSYRFHSLDRSGTNFDDIHAMLSGLRVKF
ncbi:MAG: porin, partial [Deltaproteobacteria bacterium]|nr:porin [Deltaproteobacteria bacterium]